MFDELNEIYNAEIKFFKVRSLYFICTRSKVRKCRKTCCLSHYCIPHVLSKNLIFWLFKAVQGCFIPAFLSCFPLMRSTHPPTYPHPLSQSVTSPCLCHHRNHLYETEKCKKNLNFFCIFCPWQAEPAVAATATVAMIIASTHAGAGVKNLKPWVPTVPWMGEGGLGGYQ